MKLSSKVLVLWGARIFLLPLPLIPLLEQIFSSRLVLWGVYFLLTLGVFCFFFVRYKTCVFTATSLATDLSSGFLIRRHLHIKHRHTIACARIYTPLSQKLGLCNPVLYCEGSTFILPPMTENLAKKIESEIRIRSDSNEA